MRDADTLPELSPMKIPLQEIPETLAFHPGKLSSSRKVPEHFPVKIPSPWRILATAS